MVSAAPADMAKMAAVVERNASAEWITFVAPGRVPWAEEIAEALAAGMPGRGDVLLVPVDDANGEGNVRAHLRLLPPRIQIFVEAPERNHFVAVRRNSLAMPNALRDVAHPLWDFVARISDVPNAVNWQNAPFRGNSDGSVEWDYPELAPAEPGRGLRWLQDRIRQLDVDTALENRGSRNRATNVRAGLLQLNGFLTASHELAQTIEGDPNADYWHGIMHRREPDASNAKYWFRHVGRHPVFEPLADAADAVLSNCESSQTSSWRSRIVRSGRWEPNAFIDLCEECRHADGHPLEQRARLIQWIEMLLLLQWSLK
ncbi:MAG: hypothetical protein AB7O26_19015 [Planctomycetaceae bacterium]